MLFLFVWEMLIAFNYFFFNFRFFLSKVTKKPTCYIDFRVSETGTVTLAVRLSIAKARPLELVY